MCIPALTKFILPTVLIAISFFSPYRTAQAETRIRVLFPGEYHREEVPASMEGAWWGLCRAEGQTELRKLHVFIRQVHDPIVDEPDEESGHKVLSPECDETILLLRDLGNLSERYVAEASFSPNDQTELPERYRTIDITLSDAKAQLTEGKHSNGGYKLLFYVGAAKQIIYSTETNDGGNWHLIWAGDLDADGKIDLLLEASDHYNSSYRRLFLSSAAAGDEMLSEVAVLRTNGC